MPFRNVVKGGVDSILQRAEIEYLVPGGLPEIYAAAVSHRSYFVHVSPGVKMTLSSARCPKRPEEFWAHRIPREVIVRLKVIGIYPDHAKVQVIAGEESMIGQEKNVDVRKFRLWGAERDDITRIKVGTEFRMRSSTSKGSTRGVITGWNHI